ncbi:MAG: hypothetical protein R2744_13725 [Bacteroidales bacterium]
MELEIIQEQSKNSPGISFDPGRSSEDHQGSIPKNPEAVYKHWGLDYKVFLLF